jgi:hypothetical protein
VALIQRDDTLTMICVPPAWRRGCGLLWTPMIALVQDFAFHDGPVAERFRIFRCRP